MVAVRLASRRGPQKASVMRTAGKGTAVSPPGSAAGAGVSVNSRAQPVTNQAQLVRHVMAGLLDRRAQGSAANNGNNMRPASWRRARRDGVQVWSAARIAASLVFLA